MNLFLLLFSFLLFGIELNTIRAYRNVFATKKMNGVFYMKSFTKTINGQKYKGKAFEELDIINKFKKTKEEWELINKYQKNFPAIAN